MTDKKYKMTHKWLSFSLDFKQVKYSFWFLLGEAQSKCLHLSRIPIKPDFAKTLYTLILAKGAQATTAIEGNTLSLKEVIARIENASNLPKSREYMGKEIDNIVKAFNYIAQTELGGTNSRKLSVEEIKKYNAMVLDGIETLSAEVTPGKIRTYSVVVGKYRGAPAEDCEFLIEKLCTWLNDETAWGIFGEDKKIATGILKAIIAHLYFAWIHPFGDGNGRTARLIEHKLLLDCGIPATATHLLSNFYNSTRQKYYHVLEIASQQQDGNPYGFMEYALQGFVDVLDEHINQILQEQIKVSWINYVHEHFKPLSGKLAKRQRDLLLEISNTHGDVFVSKREILALITGNEQLYKMYKDSTKTLQRDLNALTKTDPALLLHHNGMYKPNFDIILLSYIPPCIR